LARVASPVGEVSGAAFLVDKQHLVTCAHVVLDAGASQPGDIVDLDFPVLGEKATATVLEEGWSPPGDGPDTVGDTALLSLNGTVVGTEAILIRSRASIRGVDFDAYGFPSGFSHDVPSDGTVGVAVGKEWITLETHSALAIEPGFSGTAVWSRDLGAVVGMIVTRDVPTGGRLAFAIPTRVLTARSSVVKHALPTALELDPAFASHWAPRSRGVQRNSDKGWHFTGRRQSLTELAAWLASDDEPPRLKVVTGPPGTGKSALLARLATCSDRRYRSSIPDIDTNDPTIPPEGCIDITFFARQQTAAALVSHAIDLFDLDTTPDQLPSKMAELSPRPTLLIDAVDEAVDVKEFCRLLKELASAGCRILVGCRPHLAEVLRDPDPIRLDSARYLELKDVQAYALQLLEDAGYPQADELAAGLARAAGGNFLVAQLSAMAAAGGAPVGPPFPPTVRDAFGVFLDSLPDPSRARDLLLPAAYAFGNGLPPGELWLAAAESLRRPYRQADLDDLLTGPAGSFLTMSVRSANRGQDHTYRLFHEALVESLLEGRRHAEDHDRMLQTWTTRFVPVYVGRRTWRKAPIYLAKHGADHAAAASRLGDFLEDRGFLTVADLHRLVAYVHQANVDPNGLGRLLDLSASKATSLPTDRRMRLLGLGARHLGLSQLAEDLAEQTASPWRPSWAQLLGTDHRLLSGHDGAVTAVAVGEIDGAARIVSGGGDGTVRVWDAATGTQLGESLRGHDGGVNAVAVGEIDGAVRIVSGGRDGTVRVWDAATGTQLGAPLRGHDGGVTAVAVGEIDGVARIVSCGYDGTLRVWNVGHETSPEILDLFAAALSVCIGGASQLYVAAGNTICRFDFRFETPITG
jgi:hypothetical protein